jgi:hypothetical protein
MHPQLQAIADEFTAAQRHLHAFAATVPDDWWAKRASAGQWSIGECIAHLNLTAEAFLPLLRRGLEQARAFRRPAPPRYRRDPVGWLLWRTAGPPARYRARTTAPFLPTGAEPREATLAAFDRFQEEQLEIVTSADGLPLGAVRIVSPFDARLRYNVYACLTVLPRHQERHIWQAEQVLERLRGGK